MVAEVGAREKPLASQPCPDGDSRPPAARESWQRLTYEAFSGVRVGSAGPRRRGGERRVRNGWQGNEREPGRPGWRRHGRRRGGGRLRKRREQRRFQQRSERQLDQQLQRWEQWRGRGRGEQRRKRRRFRWRVHPVQLSEWMLQRRHVRDRHLGHRMRQGRPRMHRLHVDASGMRVARLRDGGVLQLYDGLLLGKHVHTRPVGPGMRNGRTGVHRLHVARPRVPQRVLQLNAAVRERRLARSLTAA
jgi:hypothetical protein